MGRESWLYAVAFFGILGAGIALIAPRLARRGAEPSPRPSPDRTREPEDAAAGEAPEPLPARPSPVTLRVRGPDGALRGPLAPAVGADLEVLEEGADEGALVRLAPHGPDPLSLGARGHLWREVVPDALRDGAVILLPYAADPVILRVREPDGRPAPGVPVLVLPRTPAGLRRTNEGGSVLLDDLPAGLAVAEVGGRERRGPTLRLQPGRDRDVRVVLEPAWRIEGRVVDAGGEPRPGAVVEGFDHDGPVGRPASSGPDGRFAWTGPIRAVLALRIRLAGRAPRTVEVRPPVEGLPRTRLGDVVAGGAGAGLRGRIAPSRGAPDARLAIEPAVAAILREVFGRRAVLGAPRRVPVAPDGSFEAQDLPAGLPLRVSVRGAGLPVDDIVRLEEGTLLWREIDPPPGHLVAGTLRDGVTGRPAVRRLVRLSSRPAPEDRTLPGDREARTDGAGRFRFEAVGRGTWHLRAFAEGRAPLLRSLRVPEDAALPDLVLEGVSDDPSGALRGRVVDDGGRALPGVAVEAGGQRARTDEEGRFRLRVPPGPLPLTAGYEPGPLPEGCDPRPFLAAVRVEAEPGGPPLEIVLPRAAGLQFRVRDGVDDRPVPWVHVVVHAPEGGVVVDRVVAAREGRVALEGLPPRPVNLALLSPRHRLVQPLALQPGVVLDLGDVRLPRGMHVEGVVSGPGGEPLAGATVSGVEAGWLGVRGGDPTVAREMSLRVSRTRGDGTFVLDGFDPRRPALLGVWAPGYAPTARRAVLEEFQETVRTHLPVRLRRGGYLAVELLDARTERPVTGALFDLQDAQTGAAYLDLVRRGVLGGVVADDEAWARASSFLLLEREEPGRYLLGPVEPRAYEVLVDRPGYRPLRRRLTVLDPDEAALRVLTGLGGETLGASQYQTWELEPGP